MDNKYEKPFLKSVIFRIDLAQPLSQSKKLASDFHEIIKGKFPLKEDISGIRFEATMGIAGKDQGTVKQTQRAVTSYKFTDASGKTILMLEPEPSNLNLSFNSYNNSDELKEFINTIVTAVNRTYGDTLIKRTGLRYINDIILDGDAFQWAPFINLHLISLLDFPPDKKKISRGLGRIELVGDNYSVLFQFGMFNPEYPNPIARKEFILDYDCYTMEEMSIIEIPKTIEDLHKAVKGLFEISILDELRDIMGVIRNE
jgi:uncharacterized protein (TIGR04255 family)